MSPTRSLFGDHLTCRLQLLLCFLQLVQHVENTPTKRRGINLFLQLGIGILLALLRKGKPQVMILRFKSHASARGSAASLSPRLRRQVAFVERLPSRSASCLRPQALRNHPPRLRSNHGRESALLGFSSAPESCFPVNHGKRRGG
eukprot:766806-Hanusia_phi.AAC.5